MQENGRRWRISHRGYRCLVTAADGQQWWVDLVRPGCFTFTEDHLAGGTRGGQWKAKRIPIEPQDLSDIGYNQVCLAVPAIQACLCFSFLAQKAGMHDDE